MRAAAAPPVLSTLLRCFAEPLAHAPLLLPPRETAPHQPLRGWLVAHKANLCLRGARADAGSAALAGYAPPITAAALLRCQRAGAALAPASPAAMDEFGMGSATVHGAHGAAYSPYSANALLARLLPPPPPLLPGSALPEAGWLSPGGSSSGSGAAQGGLGSDTGGSVRQPAALCGVVGLKPTRGGVSRWGLVAYASSLDTVGVLAPSVRAARALHAVAAAEGGGEAGRDEAVPPASAALSAASSAASSAPSPAPASDRPLAGLRIGLPREYHVAGACAHTLGAWEAAARACAALGAEVVQVSLPHTPLALPAYYVLAAGQAASNLARYDGVRYGARAPASAGGAAAAGPGAAPPAPATADALQTLYAETRSGGFGLEVARRVMVGNAVLSAASRGEYYEAAAGAAAAVASDFAAVLRSGGSEGSGDRATHSLFALGSPAFHAAAAAATGCDVLLAPTAPSLPWVSRDTPALPPLQVYLGDVCTVGASLAGLPALALPWALAPYPPEALARALAGLAAGGQWWRGSGAGGSGGGGTGDALQRLRGQLEHALRVPTGLQLIGRHGEEALLLRVGEALEGAAGFQRPAYTLEGGGEAWARAGGAAG